MTINTKTGMSIGAGVTAGAALLYIVNRRRKNRSLFLRTLVRARKEARAVFGSGIARLATGAVTTWITAGRKEADRKRRGVVEGIDAGRAAYQKVAG
jgi:hypothetical protein